ncbi:hypothetical protein LCGC14_0861220 [marine sediment metagenome]|uniref:Uncharacterized protein n=1 Tax=marine sediment metagenome TaxID=412755 RepID=A0A0F9PSV5_9ZZZZ
MVKEKLGLFFPEELERIRNNQCPICCCNIDITKFKDKLSLKEFHISGLCQKCQDKMFGVDK